MAAVSCRSVEEEEKYTGWSVVKHFHADDKRTVPGVSLRVKRDRQAMFATQWKNNVERVLIS